MDESFARIEALFGKEGLETLAHARIMLCGLGGVGGSCAEALARSGVGSLVLVDCDQVEQSNINRQAIAFSDTIGMRKTQAAQALLERINPKIETILFDERITAKTLPAIMNAAGNVDFIIDAIDDVDAKIALALEAQTRHIPHISCMGTARKLFPERLEFCDLYATHNCPLCRAVRSKARKAGIDALTVLYSTESPAQTQGDVLGTTSFTPPVAGLMLAGFAIRTLLGINER